MVFSSAEKFTPRKLPAGSDGMAIPLPVVVSIIDTLVLASALTPLT